jgi:putative aminopeptidase FrvX
MKNKSNNPSEYELLKKLCAIHAPSGNEIAVKNFLLKYIEENKSKFKNPFNIIHGDQFQDCIILVFGKPRTAIFAHMDSIGFTSRYNGGLVKIGGPVTTHGIKLRAFQNNKAVSSVLHVEVNKRTGEKKLFSKPSLPTGTELTFFPQWREGKEFVQCCYMDNRLGVYSALKVAENLKDGIIVFTCWEEHGGGSVAYLAKYIYKKWKIKQALIADITWITEGVKPGKGVVISMRDSLIPRRSYVQRIIGLAMKSKIPFQLEVEGSGGSDAKELQQSAYPWDWCFIGAAEENVHSPDEKVNKKDIESMIKLYQYLMHHL